MTQATEYRRMDEIAVGTPAFDRLPTDRADVSELLRAEAELPDPHSHPVAGKMLEPTRMETEGA